MKHTFVITTLFNGETPVFNKVGLDFSQKRWVDKMAKLLAKSARQKQEQGNNIAWAYWQNSEDFGAFALNSKDPISAVKEIKETYAKHTGAKYPQVGDTYDRDWFVNMGGEQAGKCFDLLAEGGIWPWPNARAIFEKQGDHCVVTSVTEA